MLRKRYLASLAVAGIASLSVISVANADGYEPAGKAIVAPVKDYGWGGLYVGVGIGAAQFDNSVGLKGSKKLTKEKCYDVIYDSYYKCESSASWEHYKDLYHKHKSANFGDDEWNAFGTLQVGYDHLFGKSFLAGVFGDVDFYWDAANSFSAPWLKYSDYHGDYKKIGSFAGHIDLERIWNVGVRGGFLVAPHWLVYGGGGYSRATLDGSMDVTFKSHYGKDKVLSISADKDLDGYFLEGGTEFAVHRNVKFRLAYRWQDLDGFSASAKAQKVSYEYCYSYSSYKCKRFVKDWAANADFESEIHSIRATLVIGLNPVPQPVAALK